MNSAFIFIYFEAHGTSQIYIYIYDSRVYYFNSSFSCTSQPPVQNSTEIRDASRISHVRAEHDKGSEYLSQADSTHTHTHTHTEETVKCQSDCLKALSHVGLGSLERKREEVIEVDS